jgi:hypothetical protein
MVAIYDILDCPGNKIAYNLPFPLNVCPPVFVSHSVYVVGGVIDVSLTYKGPYCV